METPSIPLQGFIKVETSPFSLFLSLPLSLFLSLSLSLSFSLPLSFSLSLSLSFSLSFSLIFLSFSLFLCFSFSFSLSFFPLSFSHSQHSRNFKHRHTFFPVKQESTLIYESQCSMNPPKCCTYRYTHIYETQHQRLSAPISGCRRPPTSQSRLGSRMYWWLPKMAKWKSDFGP